MTTATSKFGAYLMQTLGSDLLIACGNDPANENGSQIFRSADGVTFTHEYTPVEQGSLVDGQLVGSEWWCCGIDPTEDWSLGNIYKRSSAGMWTKIRTLPNVIHAFGLWRDGAAIYVAAGAHTGDNATWRGQVLKSVDDGITWQAFDVNAYRVTDVIGFDGRLYATGLDWNGSDYQYELYRSDDDGQTWQTLPVSIRYRPRLMIWNGALYAVGYDRRRLLRIAPGGTITEHTVPFFILNEWNVLASDGLFLYVLAENGMVWRSSDLISWSAYTYVAGAVSIYWWPDHGLMISDTGSTARIWIA